MDVQEGQAVSNAIDHYMMWPNELLYTYVGAVKPSSWCVHHPKLVYMYIRACMSYIKYVDIMNLQSILIAKVGSVALL